MSTRNVHASADFQEQTTPAHTPHRRLLVSDAREQECVDVCEDKKKQRRAPMHTYLHVELLLLGLGEVELLSQVVVLACLRCLCLATLRTPPCVHSHAHVICNQ